MPLFSASVKPVLIEAPLVKALLVVLGRAARLIVIVVDHRLFDRPLEPDATDAKSRTTPAISAKTRMPHDAVQRCFDTFKSQRTSGHACRGLHRSTQKARLPCSHGHVLRLPWNVLRLLYRLEAGLLHRLKLCRLRRWRRSGLRIMPAQQTVQKAGRMRGLPRLLKLLL